MQFVFLSSIWNECESIYQIHRGNGNAAEGFLPACSEDSFCTGSSDQSVDQVGGSYVTSIERFYSELLSFLTIINQPWKTFYLSFFK